MAESIAKELNELDRDLTALRIDYERFFAGDLKQPPREGRRRVEGTLRKLGNSEIEKAAERFRLQSIQARFSSMATLWEKRLLAREEGRLASGRAIPAAEAPPESPGGDAVTSSIVERRRKVDFSPLFERYCAARKALGEDVTRLRYERFEELVLKQAEEIRKKTGSGRLVFEVQTVEGRVKLLGRPSPSKG